MPLPLPASKCPTARASITTNPARSRFMSRYVSLCLLLGMVAPAWSQAADEAPKKPIGWKAGAASVVITPQENLWMAGYSARKKPADGKAQDLFAKALALEDEAGQRLVIVTMDFIG